MKKDIINIPDSIVGRWQILANLISRVAGVPAALIMRIVESDIEVFVSSHTTGNPYHKGDREYLHGSGLYCETVIKNKSRLLVPNALKDEKWKNNHDIKLDMISYLGFPILYPDGEPFGTICVLDRKENSYSLTIEQLMENFRDLLQSHLELIYMNTLLGDENRKLSDYISEIRVLRGIVPLCTYCRKIRDNSGHWSTLEEFIGTHSDGGFSHGICEECYKKMFPE